MNLRYSLFAVVLALTACGNVDWFPAYKRLPTTPDQFSFASKTGVALNTAVTSEPITVAGLTADSSPISVTGTTGSNSQYTVNSGTATSSGGTVKNGDKVTVTHTSATTLGASTVSTLSIGNVSATFTSITQTVQPFTKDLTGVAGATVSGAIALSLVSGTHTIAITNGDYSFDNFGSFFGPASGTRTIAINNQQLIYLRNVAAAGTGSKTVTTVTIDGVASTFTTTTL